MPIITCCKRVQKDFITPFSGCLLYMDVLCLLSLQGSLLF